MDIEKFIKPELLILIPVLYLFGKGIKKSKLKDNFIPLILGGAGILLSALWIFTSEEITSGKEVMSAVFTSITQGILAAGASVYINQLYVQSQKDE